MNDPTISWDYAREFMMRFLADGREHDWHEAYHLDLKWMRGEKEFAVNYRAPANDEVEQLTAGMTDEQRQRVYDHYAEEFERVAYGRMIGRIYDSLIASPEKTLELLDSALYESVYSRSANAQGEDWPDFVVPHFIIKNADDFFIHISDLALEKHRDRLVQIRGWIRYISDTPMEEVTSHVFKCLSCEATFDLPVIDASFVRQCPECKRKGPFVEMRKAEMKKFQEAIITENYEDVGTTPISLRVIFSNATLNKFAVGDRVIVIGILRQKQVERKDKSVYVTQVLEAISGEKEDVEDISITEDDVKRIEAIAKGDALEALAKMYAPEIVGLDTVKKAIVLQAVGGVEHRESMTKIRGNIHILLIGDPGLGKTQLLMANRHLAPKSLFVSEASAAGLTAAVVDVDGKKVMQAGVLVLANGGVACIDEFDKMKKEDRDAMHTAMEQGVIEKSKAGLRGSFKADTSILAAANPKYHRFDTSRSIADQIGLEDTILNRFDLIFFFVDQKKTRDVEYEKAARVISKPGVQDDGFLRKYIAYAKKIRPVLTDEIAAKIADFYAQTRSSNTEIAVNFRSLEAMKRICEASAKIRLSDKVEDADVEVMQSIYQAYLSGINYDMDTLSGITRKIRSLIDEISDILRARGKVSMEELKTLIPSFTEGQIRDAVDKMKMKGDVYEPRDGVIQGVQL
ncbi:hypothetical protein DMB44_05495 [Thermoplasma sp. Kam2015]|uniref:ATP-binding protein n=1 Tax=Thermoplasma sp. Kam2015 TaxID=2094122 RepID=UPI000D8FC8B3|nr:minichromosome maintenance protein MCM [Thermoplasma sp. Kam2015]PYB68176.1 hypothetical protein DMB44_05495 [Thermoplasma sp. Kam2015]